MYIVIIAKSNIRSMNIVTGKYKTISSKKGAALTAVMIIMVVVMIIIAVIMSLFTSNLKQAKYQESKTQAYYLALSGIDLSLSALMQVKFDILHPEGYKLLYEFLWDSDINPDMALTDEMTIGEGTVYITVSAINTGTVREVKIYSRAVLDASGISNSLTMIFSADNPMVQRWE